MSDRLAHRGGRSSQATPAAVDKSLSAPHTKNLTPPLLKRTGFTNQSAYRFPGVGFHPVFETEDIRTFDHLERVSKGGFLVRILRRIDESTKALPGDRPRQQQFVAPISSREHTISFAGRTLFLGSRKLSTAKVQHSYEHVSLINVAILIRRPCKIHFAPSTRINPA